MSGLNNDLKQEFRASKLKVDNSPLLSHLRYLAMKDYHIELYKVLKNTLNNKDNVYALLEKRLRSNPKNKTEVEKVLQAFNSEKAIVIDLCDIRDKFYAHLDKDYEKYTSKKQYVVDIRNVFHIVEMGIIALTSEEELKKELAKIESRDDYRISAF
jgi:calcineurin-like phosphoesterase family protein